MVRGRHVLDEIDGTVILTRSCRKVACVLSELGIPYETIYVDFSKVFSLDAI
jgi:hypothetical protein